VKAAIEK